MSEFNKNVWAPWRMEYIHSLPGIESPVATTRDGCFLCDYAAHPDQDVANLVVGRRDSAFVVLNRYPYTNGHLLIALTEHKADLAELSNDDMLALWGLTRDAKLLLTELLRPDGFNIGVNFGRCAGAGLPGHLHVHIVPRWNGDTNFMAVVGDVRVIPQALAQACDQLRAIAPKYNIKT